MRKLLLVILLGVSYPAFSLCVDEYCSTSSELERQARQLNAAYLRLQSFSRTHDNSITDNAFIEAQKRWRAWVPAECELAYAPLQAGNMASDIYISCLEQKYRERVIEVNRLLREKQNMRTN